MEWVEEDIHVRGYLVLLDIVFLQTEAFRLHWLALMKSRALPFMVASWELDQTACFGRSGRDGKRIFIDSTAMLKTAYLGCPGSYSHSACSQIFQDKAEPIGFPSFEAAFHAAGSGQCDFAVLPLENSLGNSFLWHLSLIVVRRKYSLKFWFVTSLSKFIYNWRNSYGHWSLLGYIPWRWPLKHHKSY